MLVTLVVLIPLGMWMLAQTPPAKAWLANYASERLSATLEHEVRLKGLHGLLPWSIRLESFTMTDDQGRWLAMENADVQLRIMPLVRGNVQVSRLQIERLSIDRISSEIGGGGDHEADRELERFPDLSIQQLIISELIIGADILPAPSEALEWPLRLRVKGHLQSGGTRLQASIDIAAPEHLAQGKIAISADIAEPPGDFNLGLDWHERQPFITRFAGTTLTEDQLPFEITMRGKGRLENLAVLLETRHGERLGIRATGLARWIDSTPSVKLEGTFAPRLLPLPFKPPEFMPDLVDFDLHLASSKEQYIVHHARFSSPNETLEFEAQYTRDDGRTTATAKLDIIDTADLRLPFDEPLRGGLQLAADIVIDTDRGHELKLVIESELLRYGVYTASNPEFKMDGRFQELSVPDWPMLPAVVFTAEGRLGSLTANNQSTPIPVEPLTWQISGHAENHALHVEKIDVALPWIAVAGSTTWHTDTQTLHPQLTFAVHDLEPLARLMDEKAEGTMTGKTEGRIDLLQQIANLAISFDWSEAGFGEIRTAVVSGTGDFAWNHDELSLETELELHRLTLPEPRLPRLNTSAHLRFSQPLTTDLPPRFDITADIAAVDGTHGEFSADLRMKGEQTSADVWAGSVKLQTNLYDSPVLVDSNWRRQSSGFALSELRATAPETIIEGDLEVYPTQGMISGKLTGKSQELRYLTNPFTPGIQGHADFELNLSRDDDTQTLGLNVVLAQLVTPWGSVERVQAQMHVADLFGRLPTGDLELTLENLDCEPLKLARYAPTSLSGSIHLGGDLNAPEIDIALNTGVLQIQQEADVESVNNGHVKFAYAERRASLNLRYRLSDDDYLEASANMSMNLSLHPLAWEISKQEAIEGHIALNSRLGPLLQPLAPAGHAFDARISGSATVTGTIEDPDIQGELALHDGMYENYFTGTVIQNLEMLIQGDVGGVRLQEMRADDGGSGLLRGAGHWLPADDPPLLFELGLDEFKLYDIPRLTIVAAGEMKLSGQVDQLQLTGDLEIAPVHAQVAEHSESFVELDVVETYHGVVLENDKSGPGETTGAHGMGQDDLGLDLDLNLRSPSRIFVRGRGLDTEWRGEVNVQGTLRKPRIAGTLEVVRGTYTLVGKRLRVVEGELKFYGDHPPRPTIRVVGEHQTAEAVIRVTLAGDAESPELTMESQPSMPENEILSQILFGRNTGRINAFQAIMLANALDELSGADTGAFDIQTRLRRATGLDQLSIITQGTGADSQIDVGKYLTDNVYFSYNRSLGRTADDSLNVEVEITPSFSLETGASINGGGGIGFNWNFDY